jgi:hypothetical protein
LGSGSETLSVTATADPFKIALSDLGYSVNYTIGTTFQLTTASIPIGPQVKVPVGTATSIPLVPSPDTVTLTLSASPSPSPTPTMTPTPRPSPTGSLTPNWSVQDNVPGESAVYIGSQLATSVDPGDTQNDFFCVTPVSGSTTDLTDFTLRYVGYASNAVLEDLQYFYGNDGVFVTTSNGVQSANPENGSSTDFLYGPEAQGDPDYYGPIGIAYEIRNSPPSPFQRTGFFAYLDLYAQSEEGINFENAFIGNGACTFPNLTNPFTKSRPKQRLPNPLTEGKQN